MKDLVCLIPAKSKSERCPNKNIRPFAGSTLVDIKIEQAKRVGIFDRIVVNSDSELIGDIARKHGVEFQLRPYEFTICGNHEFHQYLAKANPNVVLCAMNCTSPMIEDKTIVECVNAYRQIDDPSVSVNTVADIKSFLFDGNEPINFDMSYFPKSQDIRPVFEYTSGVSIADTNYMVESNGWLMLKNHHFIHVGKIEALDIDYDEDFQICQFFFLRMTNGGNKHDCGKVD